MRQRRELAAATPDPLSRILVATDFSPGGRRVVERAAQLPLAPGAVISIVHVLSPTGDAEIDARKEEDARLALERAKADAVRTARAVGRQGLDLRTHCAWGIPLEEITRHAAAAHAELVLVGRFGWRTFRRLLLGSTAERIIRHSGVPVLVGGLARALIGSVAEAVVRHATCDVVVTCPPRRR